jgi:hypothetical protein
VINTHGYCDRKQKASAFAAFLVYRCAMSPKELARCILVTKITPLGYVRALFEKAAAQGHPGSRSKQDVDGQRFGRT